MNDLVRSFMYLIKVKESESEVSQLSDSLRPHGL